MRAIDQAVLDANVNIREVSSYVDVRYTMLNFNEDYGFSKDYEIIDGNTVFSTDVTYNEPGYDGLPYVVIRIACVVQSGHYKLWTQQIDDLTNYSEVYDWHDMNTEVKAGSHPALYGNRVFYQLTNGDMYYADLVHTEGQHYLTLSNYTYIGTAYYAAGIAPVSLTEFYTLTAPLGGSGYYYNLIDYYNLSPSQHYTWHGRVYGYNPNVYPFDAERVGSKDYIMWCDGGGYVVGGTQGQRTLMITRMGLTWSDTQLVVPLDIVEDTSQFVLGGLSIINNYLMCSGLLKRPQGSDFQAYTMGPIWSMGRDVYIGTNGSVEHTYGGHTYPQAAGKLIYDDYDKQLWFIGLGTFYWANATYKIGYDSPSFKTTIDKVHNVRFGATTNSPSSLNFDIPASTSHSSLVANGEVTWYIKIGGHSAKMGVFNIDSVVINRDTQGKQKTVSCRGRASKALGQWQSDASFDYWSQTKQTCDPSLLSEMLRASGDWGTQETGELYLKDLNTEGIMYTVQRDSRNGVVQARFKVPTNTMWNPRWGVCINYFNEAGGKTTGTQETHDHRGQPYIYTNPDESQNGIFAIYRGTSHMLDLIFRQELLETTLTSAALTIPYDTWHWLKLEFHEGLITVSYRLDSSTTWTTVLTHTFALDGYFPWGKNYTGKGGIYCFNLTPYGLGYAFDAENSVIPVSSFTSPYGMALDTPAIYKVDEEQISVVSKSPDVGATSHIDLVVASGQTFAEAPHDNPLWTDGVIYTQDIPVTHDQEIGRTTACLWSGKSVATQGTTCFHSVKFKVKKVGNPTDLHCYLATDAIDDASPPVWAAVMQQSASHTAITTDYQWIEFVFGGDVTVTDKAGYWFMLTTAPYNGSPVIDANNYYILGINEDLSDEEGVNRFYGTSWFSHDPDCAIPFIAYGSSVNGDGYEIYFEGADAVCKARNIYNNCALRSEDGTVFQIMDYDSTAPDQWIPKCTYVLPDKWEDHVGDTNEGDWQTQDKKRVFVKEDPSGAFETGDDAGIWRALVADARGYGSTNVVAHADATKVSEYTDCSILCNRFDYFTGEPDMRFEDMVREIGRKAGVNDVVAEKLLDQTISSVTAGWHVQADIAAHEIDTFNLIAKFDQASGEIGVAFHLQKTGGNYHDGRIITVTVDNVNLYAFTTGTPTLIESVPVVVDEVAGTITISVQNTVWTGLHNIYSVWMENKLLASFVDTQNTDPLIQHYAGVIIHGIGQLDIDWSALDLRVDNYILDMGKNGMSLLQYLIGEKHYWFRDNQDGGLTIIRNRHVINSSPTAFNLTAQEQIASTDIDLATRVRIEGADIAEVFDAENMALYGNLFALINMMEVNNADDARREGNWILNDLQNRIFQDTFVGAAEPRIEPDDIIFIYTTDGTQEIVVYSIQMQMDFTDTQVIFDMNLGGYAIV